MARITNMLTWRSAIVFLIVLAFTFLAPPSGVAGWSDGGASPRLAAHRIYSATASPQ